VISRYTISGSFDYNRVDYQDEPTFTDLSTYTGNLYLYYILNEQRDLFANFRTRFSDEATGETDIDDALSAGVSGRVIGPFNGSIQLGFGTRIARGGPDRGTYDDFTATGTTTWNINRRMTLSGNLTRDFSTIATGQSVQITSAGLTYQDSLTSKASTTLNGDVGENQFLGDEGLVGPEGQQRVDYFYSLGAAYFYTVNQHLKISINYTYYRSYSNLAYAEFPRHQVNLTLSSHW
jgi:hypothetical protein